MFLGIATYALVAVGLFACVDLCTLAAVVLESANVTLLLGRDVRRAALTAVTILELAVSRTTPRLICGHHCRKEQYNPQCFHLPPFRGGGRRRLWLPRVTRTYQVDLSRWLCGVGGSVKETTRRQQ